MQSRAQDAGKGGLVPPIIAETGAKTRKTQLYPCMYLNKTS